MQDLRQLNISTNRTLFLNEHSVLIPRDLVDWSIENINHYVNHVNQNGMSL
jgi:hypothetical protein